MSKRKRGYLLLGLVATTGAIAAFTQVTPDRRTPAGDERPQNVLAVATAPIRIEPYFLRHNRFSGRVQASRTSQLGFDTGGRLARVLVREGDRVEAGALLAELDTERLRARRAERVAARDEATARLALADVTLERQRNVVAKGGVSQQGLDEAREAQRSARAALALARQRIATLDVEIAKTRLIAPFAGTVVARIADEGRVLSDGQPVLTLQENASPEIRIGIAGRSREAMQPGEVYQLEWRDAALPARLRALLPIRADTTRTVAALFDPLDPPSSLLPGDLVSLTLEQREDRSGAWLPIQALTQGDRGLWSILVAVPDPRSETGTAATYRLARRIVDPLHAAGERVFVQGELQNGDRYVVSGLQRVVPGQWVRLETGDSEATGVAHD